MIFCDNLLAPPGKQKKLKMCGEIVKFFLLKEWLQGQDIIWRNGQTSGQTERHYFWNIILDRKSSKVDYHSCFKKVHLNSKIKMLNKWRKVDLSLLLLNLMQDENLTYLHTLSWTIHKCDKSDMFWFQKYIGTFNAKDFTLFLRQENEQNFTFTQQGRS